MNILFDISTGYETLRNASKRHLKFENDDSGEFPVRIPLNEIRSTDLVAGEGETLQIVDDVITVVPRPDRVVTPSEQIKNLWKSLSDGEKAAVYTYAPEALLAWEREELEVMIKLVLANENAAIADLKAAVKSILGI